MGKDKDKDKDKEKDKDKVCCLTCIFSTQLDSPKIEREIESSWATHGNLLWAKAIQTQLGSPDKTVARIEAFAKRKGRNRSLVEK